MISDPYFTSASGLNFSLRTGSPCINAGASIGWTADIAGVSIPQGGTPDIGAYEFASGGTTPTPTTYTLSVGAANGTVARTPNQSSYTAGETVTLQATANSGYTFTGWSGDLTGSTNPATLVMDSDKSVTAGFLADAPCQLHAHDRRGERHCDRDAGQGQLHRRRDGHVSRRPPTAGYTFTGWSGALTGSTNPASLTMDSNKSVTVAFAANAYTLAVIAANGSVSRSPDKSSYTYGEVVTLQATAGAGYSFSGWSGDLAGTTNPTTLVMNANKSVTAGFASVDSDGQAPVLSNCLPAPDSIQAPRNTLVILQSVRRGPRGRCDVGDNPREWGHRLHRQRGPLLQRLRRVSQVRDQHGLHV